LERNRENRNAAGELRNESLQSTREQRNQDASRQDQDRRRSLEQRDNLRRDRAGENSTSGGGDRTAGEAGRSARRETDSDHDSPLGISFGIDEKDLLTVRQVAVGSLAEQAGLLPGDRIISVDGAQVDSRPQFNRWLARRPGSRIAFDILRNGERRTVQMMSPHRVGYRGDRSDRDQTNDLPDPEDSTGSEGRDSSDHNSGFLGVRFDPRYGNAPVVLRVFQGSPADFAGIRTGDEIIAINGSRVRSADEVILAVSEIEPGKLVDVRVMSARPADLILRTGDRESIGSRTNQATTRDGGTRPNSDPQPLNRTYEPEPNARR
jgi:S1-C subfamily serine protease